MLKRFHNYCILIKTGRRGFPWEKTTKGLSPSVCTNCETALTAVERNYISTALYKPVRQGRHTAQRPEGEEKYGIDQTQYRKRQRHGGTPGKLMDNSLGGCLEVYVETAEKERVCLPL
jgi:hypothetical protein